MQKIIGVLLDGNLSFKEHVHETVKKSYKMCNTIFMNFKYVSIFTFIDLGLLKYYV